MQRETPAADARTARALRCRVLFATNRVLIAPLLTVLHPYSGFNPCSTSVGHANLQVLQDAAWVEGRHLGSRLRSVSALRSVSMFRGGFSAASCECSPALFLCLDPGSRLRPVSAAPLCFYV